MNGALANQIGLSKREAALPNPCRLESVMSQHLTNVLPDDDGIYRISDPWAVIEVSAPMSVVMITGSACAVKVTGAACIVDMAGAETLFTRIDGQ